MPVAGPFINGGGDGGREWDEDKRRNEANKIAAKKSKPGSASSKRKQRKKDSKGREDEVNMEEPELNGFDRGLTPDAIIGAEIQNGELLFLIRWRGTDEVEYVPARLANVRCPDLVIAFYEVRLQYVPPETRDQAVAA